VSWPRSRDEVIAALNAGELQRVTGGQAAGEGWITRARQKHATAQSLADTDPETAYVTAYDAVRFALTGVLAQQGLRATQKGGHKVVEEIARAQFGKGFAAFGTLRRRRVELEYPSYPGEEPEQDELVEALATALEIINDADKLVEQLGIFRP
jgi:HEPN domain-containing protein